MKMRSTSKLLHLTCRGALSYNKTTVNTLAHLVKTEMPRFGVTLILKASMHLKSLKVAKQYKQLSELLPVGGMDLSILKLNAADNIKTHASLYIYMCTYMYACNNPRHISNKS